MSDDDIFAAMVEGLDLEVPDDVVDVSKLDATALIRRFSAVRQALFDLKQMREPRTDEGRALHSERVALLVEMRNRQLL